MNNKAKHGWFALVGLTLSIVASAQSQDPQRPSRSVRDIGVELHGGNPLSPTADSLIGRYLAATNASTRVRQFPNSPVGNTIPPYQLGPEKLAVAVGPNTMAAFLDTFRSRNYFFIYHTPQSNTFHFVYKGFDGSYALPSSYRPSFYAQGTLLIPILLSDSEATRLEAFFQLAAIRNPAPPRPSPMPSPSPTPGPRYWSGQDLARAPWTLAGADGNYSAGTAFVGCTNWVGQLPIGDELVNEYIFPSGDADGSSPRRAPLRDYATPVGFNAEQDALLRSVWSVPGHKQLGELLDPMAMRRGEFANIGWVTYTAIGTLPVERAPVVFYEVNDPTLPLQDNFPLNIAPYK